MNVCSNHGAFFGLQSYRPVLCSQSTSAVIGVVVVVVVVGGGGGGEGGKGKGGGGS